MYLPSKEGGIGLAKIQIKTQSLIFNQVMKIFIDRKSTWINYRHTYLGIALREGAAVKSIFFNNCFMKCCYVP